MTIRIRGFSSGVGCCGWSAGACRCSKRATRAGVSRITGWRYGQVYQEQGLKGLLAEQWEGPQSSLTPHVATLEASFAEQPPHTVAEAADRIERLTGVRRKKSQVREFLRNTLGLSWQRTGAIPCPPKKTSLSTSRSKPTF